MSNRRIIRRYPTGALSEKVALILPSLLSWASKKYPIASPFLVARSLGFTGGTWDKLSVIDGFTFPAHGEEAIRTMRQCGVAMTVTHGSLNPADRILYQLRSATGTIESPELIVSSIASKQLAVPADHLLMDVRFGPGAFLEDSAAAQAVSRHMEAVILDGGVDCFSKLTSTEQPGGMSVGNAVEVLEALAVMGSTAALERGWSDWCLAQQSALVLKFYALLMARALPNRSADSWKREARDALASGAVLGAFWELLRAHGVPNSTVSRLDIEPEDELLGGLHRTAVPANATTRIQSVDQRRLGHAVNFLLGTGGNDFGGNVDR